MSDDERVSNGADAPLSDGPLLDLLDALVESRGKVAAAEALGVNYRTMTNCYDSRRVSRRMRRALQEFRDASGVAIEVGGGDGVSTDSQVEALGKRAAELEEENRELRELVEAQAVQLEALQGQISRLEEEEHSAGDAGRVGVGEVDGQRPPPRRGAGPLNAGVVTLETQHDEEDAFRPCGWVGGGVAVVAEPGCSLGQPGGASPDRGATLGVGGRVAQGFPPDPASGDGTTGRLPEGPITYGGGCKHWPRPGGSWPGPCEDVG